MTVRGILAAIAAVVIYLLAARFMMQLQGASISDFLASLFFQQEHRAMFCFILALGALVSGLLSFVSAFAAFPREDDEDDQEFPIGAIPFFLVVSLGFLWFALGCSYLAETADEPVEETTTDTGTLAALEPAPAPEPEAVPLPVPEPEAVVDLAPALPPVEVSAAPVEWPFKYPLIKESGHMSSPVMNAALEDMFPMDDPDGAVHAMLCGKAWVAIAGASSEEGPLSRNRARSRLRAELAIRQAQRWMNAHADSCEPSTLVGLDLGQHASTMQNPPADGSATGYQRQVLMLSREAAAGEDKITTAGALNEVRSFLEAADNEAALLGQRRYQSEPVVFSPDGR